MDALDIDKAHIVGHDWGSSPAWAFAALYPDRTLQLVATSVGNPNGYFKVNHANEQKQKRSNSEDSQVLCVDCPDES